METLESEQLSVKHKEAIERFTRFAETINHTLSHRYKSISASIMK